MSRFPNNQLSTTAPLTFETRNSQFSSKKSLGWRSFVKPSEEQIFQPLPWRLWVASLLLAALGCLSANPILTPFSIMLLPVLASLLWFRGEPPALLYACAMQWLQASMAIFYSDINGVPLSEEWKFGGYELEQAISLSLVSILVLAIGMRMMLIGRNSSIVEKAEIESRLLQPNRIFVLYIIAYVGFSVVDELTLRLPTLRQPLGASMTLKWVLVFLLAHSVLIQKRQHSWLFIVVGMEFLSGLLGYFAGFKSIFFMILVVLPSAKLSFSRWRLIQFSVISAIVVATGVIWSVIKVEYREFLNDGTGQQVIVAPVSQRIEKLDELLTKLTFAKLDEGLEQLVLRVSYVSFFAATIDRVPSKIPYEDGSIWWGTIEHVLKPRFLFPDKPDINDSQRTIKYTGIQVASEEEGTTITIGYVGESYIDFGPIGMFLPILFLGMFYGFIYRFFVYHQPIKVVGYAMATSILIFGAYTIETSGIKLVGGNLMSLLVIGLFSKVAGRWFWRQITVKGAVPPELKGPALG